MLKMQSMFTFSWLCRKQIADLCEEEVILQTHCFLLMLYVHEWINLDGRMDETDHY